MKMPSSAVSTVAERADLMCVETQRAYAREPPAMAMTTVSAPSSARNSNRAPFPAICSAIICGTMHNASMAWSMPAPFSVN